MSSLQPGLRAERENASECGPFYLVAKKEARTDRNGSTYLVLTLSDATGNCEARMWSVSPEDNARFAQGDVVKVKAVFEEYNGRRQIKIETIEKAARGEYDLGELLPKTTKNIAEMWAALNGYVDSFSDPNLKALIQSLVTDEKIAAALQDAPAAKSMHHAWIGGLLEHLISLLGMADATAKHYVEINRDLLLTGVLLHDIGKLRELSWRTGFDYTVDGQLLGHITIGIGIVTRKIDAIPDFPPRLKTLVLHMILSHHGHLEFGSPKLPMIPEALVLHYLDDMDAKLQTIRSEFERSKRSGHASGQMTEWVRALERPLLNTEDFLAEDESTLKKEV
jgi:3'-5' exoribonuclease